jgi:DNA-binding XRE family transcriptional regulator
MEARMKINGDAVRALRERKSWSQEHLANASGLSVRTVQRVEVASVGSAETRLALAAALGVPVADLCHDADARSTNWIALRRRVPLWGWVGVGVVLSVVVAGVLMSVSGRGAVVEYSTFLRQVSEDQVERATFDGDVIRGQFRSGETFVVHNPQIDNSASINALRNHSVAVATTPPRSSFLTQFISSLPILLPIMLLIAACIYYMRRTRSTGVGA